MGLDIRGALNNLPKNNRKSYANHDDGRPMTNNEFREYLYDRLSEGKKVLPMTDCDNFCYQKGCLGHINYILIPDMDFEEGNG